MDGRAILLAATAALVLNAPHAAPSGMGKATKAAAEALKDPASAKFRHVVSMQENAGYCGEVNAKNSYGGYVGYRKFYVIGTTDAYFDNTDTEAFSSFPTMWEKYCIPVWK
jgi:hypothetical protein